MRLPVTLALKSSMTLAGALVLAHGVAALAVLPTMLPAAAKTAIVAVVAASLFFNLRRHVLRRPLRALTLKADGALQIERHDGTCADAAVQPQSTVFPWLVVLRLKMEQGTLVLTLPRDALSSDEHRQLRVWLRWRVAA